MVWWDNYTRWMSNFIVGCESKSQKNVDQTRAWIKPIIAWCQLLPSGCWWGVVQPSCVGFSIEISVKLQLLPGVPINLINIHTYWFYIVILFYFIFNTWINLSVLILRNNTICITSWIFWKKLYWSKLDSTVLGFLVFMTNQFLLYQVSPIQFL